jgi:hypothetical protein
MKNLYIGLVLIMALFFVSCHKSNVKNTATATDSTTVYIVGDEQKSAVWKNGVPNYLLDGTMAFGATSMYVNGTDVYVVGTGEISGIATAKLWKNGVVSNFSDGTYDAFPNSVFVNGSDVYVAGFTSVLVQDNQITSAILWKNGVATTLSYGKFGVCKWDGFIRSRHR